VHWTGDKIGGRRRFFTIGTQLWICQPTQCLSLDENRRRLALDCREPATVVVAARRRFNVQRKTELNDLVQFSSETPNAIIVLHWIIRSWYSGRWRVGCYMWYSEDAAPPSPLLAVPDVTAHPSTASVAITVLLYDGLLLCGFNVAIKGLIIV